MSFRTRQVKLFLLVMILLSLVSVGQLLLAGNGIGLFDNTGTIVIKGNDLNENQSGIQATLTNTTILSNVVTNSEWYGIRMQGNSFANQDSYTLRNNIVMSSGRSGIQIIYAEDVILDNNLVGLSGSLRYSEEISLHNKDFHGSGIQIKSSQPPLITNNDLFSNWYSGIALYSVPGTIGPNNFIHNNGDPSRSFSFFTGCSEASMYGEPSAGVVIRDISLGQSVSIINDRLENNYVDSALKRPGTEGKLYLEGKEIRDRVMGQDDIGLLLTGDDVQSSLLIDCDLPSQSFYNLSFSNKAVFGLVISGPGTNGITIRNCSFFNNYKVSNTYGQTYSFGLGGGLLIANGGGGLIQNNTFFNNGIPGDTRIVSSMVIGAGQSAGLVARCPDPGLRIENNVFWSNANDGIEVNYAGSESDRYGPVIIGNTIYSNGNTGIDVHANQPDDDPLLWSCVSSIRGLSLTNILSRNNIIPILNNTIYNNDNAGIGVALGTVEISGNVIYSNGWASSEHKLKDEFQCSQVTDRVWRSSGIQLMYSTIENGMLVSNTVHHNFASGIMTWSVAGTIGNYTPDSGDDNYIYSNGNGDSGSGGSVCTGLGGAGFGGISARDLWTLGNLYVTFENTANLATNTIKNIQQRVGSPFHLYYNDTVVNNSFWDSNIDVVVYIDQDDKKLSCTDVGADYYYPNGISLGNVWGVAVMGATGITIENCRIYSNCYDSSVCSMGTIANGQRPGGGVLIAAGSEVYMVNNTIENNGYRSFVQDESGSVGISIRCAGENTSLVGNIIKNNANDGINLFDTAGIIGKIGSMNIIKSNGRHGIGLASVTGGTTTSPVISYNSIANNGAFGIGGISLFNMSVSILNNVIMDNHIDTSNTFGIGDKDLGGGIGFFNLYKTAYLEGNTIKNNQGGQDGSPLAGIGFTLSNATVYLLGNTVENNNVGTSPAIVKGAAGIGFSDFTIANDLSIANNYIAFNNEGFVGGLGFDNLYTSSPYTVSIVNNTINSNGWGLAGAGALAGGVGNINTNNRISWWVEQNTINNNKGLSSGAFGTKDSASPVMSFKNNVIAGNTVFDTCASGDCSADYMGAGIGLVDSVTALYVDNNFFSGNLPDDPGLSMAGGAAGMYWNQAFRDDAAEYKVDYFKFTGNTASNSGQGAFTVRRVRFELEDGILVSGNSLNNSSVSIWFHGGNFNNATGAMTSFVLKNNSIINSPGTYGAVGLRDARTFDNKIYDNFINDDTMVNIGGQGDSSGYGISNEKGVGYLSIYNNTVQNLALAGIWIKPRSGDGSSITGTNLIYSNYVFNNGWADSIVGSRFLGNGIGIQAGDSVSGENVSIYNNIVDSNRHVGIGLREITAAVTLTGNTVRNNARGGIGIISTSVVNGDILVSGNRIYRNTNPHTNGVGGIGTSLANSAVSLLNNQVYSNTGRQEGGVGVTATAGPVVISLNNIYGNTGSGLYASGGIGFTLNNTSVYLIGNTVENNTMSSYVSAVGGAAGIGFSDFTIANDLSIANNYIALNNEGFVGGLGFDNLYTSSPYTVSIVNNTINSNGWGLDGAGALAGGIGNIGTGNRISWWVENNTINNNKGLSSGAFGTKDSASPVMSFKNNVIAGNTVFDTCASGDCSADYMGAGIGLVDSVTALYVDNNFFSGNLPDDSGLAMAGGAAGMYWNQAFRDDAAEYKVGYFKFTGNTASNSGQGAFTVRRVRFELEDGILVSGNSLNNSSVSIWFHGGSLYNGAMTPFVLKNNSIINSPGTYGAVGLRDAQIFDNKIHDNFISDDTMANLGGQGDSSGYGISNEKGVGYLSIYNNTVQNLALAGIWVKPRSGDGADITGTNLIYSNYIFNNGWADSIVSNEFLGNGIGINQGDPASGEIVSIYNNTVTSNMHRGVAMRNITAAVKILDNTIRNNTRGGIGLALTQVAGSDPIVISGNLIHHNTDLYTNGIGGIGGSLVNSALSIFNNRIYSNTGQQEGGVGMSASNGTVVITFNNIYSNTGNGLNAAGGIGIKGITSSDIEVQILDNTIYSNQGINISGIGISESNSTLVMIAGNSVRNNATSGIGIWNSPAVTIQNNFLFSNSWTDTNTVFDGEHYASGIQLRSSTFANVTGNIIRNHLFAGIASFSSGGTIGDNVIAFNGDSSDQGSYVCEGVGGNGRGGISVRELDSGEVLSIENPNISDNLIRSVQHRPGSQGTVYYNGDVVSPGTFWTGNDVGIYITASNQTVDCDAAPYNGSPWNGAITGSDIWGIAVMGFVSNVTIKNCDIYDNATVSNTAGPNGETVGGGVLIAAGSGVYMENNSIYNNGLQAQSLGSGGYVGVALRCASNGTTLVNNIITGNANDGIVVFDSDGYIGLSGKPNTVYNNGRNGIGIRSLAQGGSTTPEVAYNLIYSNKKFGVGVWSLNNQSPDISQNSIYNNRESGIGIRWTTSPMTIRDNYITSNGLDQVYANDEYYASGIQARDSTLYNNSLTGNTIRNHWFAGIALNNTEGTIGNDGAGGDNYIYSNGTGTASSLCAGVGGTGHGGISARDLTNTMYVYNDTSLNSNNFNRDIQHKPGSSAALIYNGTVVNSTSWTEADVAVYINSDTVINCDSGPITQISGGKIWGVSIVGEYDVSITNCRVFDNCTDSNYCNVVSPEGQIVGGGILIAGGARVTLDNNSIYNNGHTSQTISNGGFAGVAVRCASSSTTLINNTIESNANDGIALYDTYGYIGLSGQENTIKNNGRHGIGLNSFAEGTSQGPEIAYNRIFSNTAYGIGSWSLINMNASIFNNVIYSNHLSNNLGEGGKDIGGGIGLVNFYSLALIRDNIIRNNTGFDSGGIGVSLSNGAITISGNQVYSNANSGSGAGGIGLLGLSASASVVIENNTVNNNQSTQIGGIGIIDSSSTNVSIYNNTVQNNRQSGLGMFSAVSFSIRNNFIVSNGIDDTQIGDEFYASGIQVKDSTIQSDSVIDNTIRNHKFSGIAVNNSGGTIGPNNIIKYNGDPNATGSCPSIGGNGRGGVAVRDLNTGNLTVANNTVENNYYKVKALRPGSCGDGDNEFWFDNGAGGVDQVTCGGSPLTYTKIGLYITPDTMVNNIGAIVTYPGDSTVVNDQTLTGTSEYAVGIAVMGMMDNVTISNTSIYNFGTDSATTSNLGPYGPGGYQSLGAGILVAGGANVYMDGNSIYNNGAGVLVEGEGGYAGLLLACSGDDTTLVNNTIYSNSNDGIAVYKGGGSIGLSGQPNTIRYNPRYGVGMMSLVNDLKIIDNSILNNNRGIGGYDLAGEDILIVSNYLYNNSNTADPTKGAGVMFSLYNGNITLANNWIDSNDQGVEFRDAVGGALLIRDNTIVNQGESGIRMLSVTNNELNVSIENNSIANNYSNGIMFMNTTMANTYIFSNNLIHNRLCAIQFGGDSRISSLGVGDVNIVSNYIFDNEYQGLSSHDAAIRFSNIYSNDRDNVVITDNTIDSNNAGRSAVIFQWFGDVSVSIANNTITNNSQYGIQFQEGQRSNISIENNFLSGNRAGIRWQANLSTNVSVINNVITSNSDEGLQFQYNRLGSVIIENNTLNSNRNGLMAQFNPDLTSIRVNDNTAGNNSLAGFAFHFNQAVSLENNNLINNEVGMSLRNNEAYLGQESSFNPISSQFAANIVYSASGIDHFSDLYTTYGTWTRKNLTDANIFSGNTQGMLVTAWDNLVASATRGGAFYIANDAQTYDGSASDGSQWATPIGTAGDTHWIYYDLDPVGGTGKTVNKVRIKAGLEAVTWSVYISNSPGSWGSSVDSFTAGGGDDLIHDWFTSNNFNFTGRYLKLESTGGADNRILDDIYMVEFEDSGVFTFYTDGSVSGAGPSATASSTMSPPTYKMKTRSAVLDNNSQVAMRTKGHVDMEIRASSVSGGSETTVYMRYGATVTFDNCLVKGSKDMILVSDSNAILRVLNGNYINKIRSGESAQISISNYNYLWWVNEEGTPLGTPYGSIWDIENKNYIDGGIRGRNGNEFYIHNNNMLTASIQFDTGLEASIYDGNTFLNNSAGGYIQKNQNGFFKVYDNNFFSNYYIGSEDNLLFSGNTFKNSTVLIGQGGGLVVKNNVFTGRFTTQGNEEYAAGTGYDPSEEHTGPQYYGSYSVEGNTFDTTNLAYNCVSTWPYNPLTDLNGNICAGGDCCVNTAGATLTAGPLPEPANISTTTDTELEKLDVFDFTVTDSGDGLPVVIKQLKITRSPNDGTGDWTDYLGGVKLTDSDGTVADGTITSNAVTFGDGTSTVLSVPDTTSRTYTLSTWLKSTLPAGAGGEIIEFDINPNDDLIVSSGDNIGTSFASGASSVTSNNKPVVIASGLDYRRAITITNSGSQLTDFQVSFTVDTRTPIEAGSMQSDGADIRFHDSDDYTDLPYWIEEGINTANTKIWVKVPSLPTGDTTIYMYYGDPYAQPLNSGTRTFEFFDDFNDGDYTANPSWTSGSGTWTVNNGVMETSSTGDPVIYEDSYISTDYVMEGKAMISSPISSGDQQACLLLRVSNKDNYYGYGYRGLDNPGKWELFNNDDTIFLELAEHSPQTMTQGTWYKQKIQVAGTGFKAKSWVSGSSEPGSWGIDNITDSTHPSGQVGLKGTYVSATVQFDDIFVHKYAAAEPAVSLGSEQAVSLDSNATLAAGPLSVPATIDSAIDDQSEALAVFDFTIDDVGGDNQGVKVIQLAITRGSLDTTGDWTNYIAGAELTYGASTLTNSTITSSAITFGDGNSNLFTVSEGGSRTYTLAIWLQPNLTPAADGKVIEFDIHPNDDLAVYYISTGFAPGVSVTSGGQPAIQVVVVNYDYTRAITIYNSGSTLTDYQVKINLDTQSLVSEGKMQADGDDIRFRDSNDSTGLSYWFDPASDNMNSSSTDIWIKVPSLTNGNNTIDMYYGNVSESGLSDGDATFEFFDDFESYTLGDLAGQGGWESANGSPQVVSEDGKNMARLISHEIAKYPYSFDNSAGKSIIARAKAIAAGEAITLTMFDGNSAGWPDQVGGYNFLYYGWSNTTNKLFRAGTQLGSSSSGVSSTGTYYTLESRWYGTDFTGLIDWTVMLSATDSGYSSRSYLGVVGCCSSGHKWGIDTVFIRKYESNDPGTNNGISMGAEQCMVSNDTDATLAAGPLTEPATIDSTIANEALALPVFDFTITEGGGADGKGIFLTRIDITKGGNDNTGGWTNIIGGAKLTDDTTTLTNSIMTSNAITFGDESSTIFSVGHNSNKTFTLSIWLKGGTNEKIEFDIDPNDDIAVDCSGSGFTPGNSVIGSPLLQINELWNYNYTRAINISNSGSTLTDYQVKINLDTASLISEGKMQADGDDIRFRDSNDSTVLPYWFDPADDNINSSSTDIWIKVPSLTNGNNTIDMYYGNVSDSAASNGSDTFEFFDDFESYSVGGLAAQSTWEDVKGTAQVVTEDSKQMLKINNSDNLVRHSFSFSNATDAGRSMVARVKTILAGETITFTMFDGNNSAGLENMAGYNFLFYGWGGSSTRLYRSGSQLDSISDSATTGTYYTHDTRWYGNNHKGFRDGVEKLSAVDSGYSSRNYLGIGGWSTSEWGVDTIFVRKYESNDPGTGSVGAEQCLASNDTDAILETGLLAEPATIDSTINNQASALDVFDFKITDAGGGDGLGVFLTRINITKGGNDNTGGWTNIIGGAELTDGITTVNSTVTSNALIFGDANSTIFSVSDSSNQTYTLSIWLNGGTNETIEFDINPNDDITVDCSGSSFAAGAADITSGSQPVINEIWGYLYKRDVTITYAGSALTDYQVKINLDTASLISATKMQADGDDIRFRDSDDSTLLSYWFDPASDNLNTSSTDIWIKVPSIPNGGKTIYLYYGNASDSAASNGGATFEFFDDFESYPLGDLNGQGGWGVENGSPQVVSEDGKNMARLISHEIAKYPYSFDNSAGAGRSIIARTKAIAAGEAITLTMFDGNSAGWPDQAGGYNFLYYGWSNTTNKLFRAGTQLGSSSSSSASTGTYYTLESRWYGTGLTGLIDWTVRLSSTDSGYSSRPYLGVIGCCGSSHKWGIDTIFIRKYESNDPTTGVGAEY